MNVISYYITILQTAVEADKQKVKVNNPSQLDRI